MVDDCHGLEDCEIHSWAVSLIIRETTLLCYIGVTAFILAMLVSLKKEHDCVVLLCLRSLLPFFAVFRDTLIVHSMLSLRITYLPVLLVIIQAVLRMLCGHHHAHRGLLQVLLVAYHREYHIGHETIHTYQFARWWFSELHLLPLSVQAMTRDSYWCW